MWFHDMEQGRGGPPLRSLGLAHHPPTVPRTLWPAAGRPYFHPAELSSLALQMWGPSLHFEGSPGPDGPAEWGM